MKGRDRPVPLRTCLVCRRKATKRDLMRIVATPEGSVEPDPSGKLPGRGAYICANGSCAPGSLRRGRIDHALRRKLSDDEWDRVSTYNLARSP